jgi:hypothetical protein
MKKFGKMSRSQFVRTFHKHEDLGKLLETLRRDLQQSSKISNWIAENGDISWSALYELPFASLAAVAIVAMGDLRTLQTCAAQADPQEAILNWAESYEPASQEGVTPDQAILVVACIFAIVHCWAAVGWYSTSLCTLIERARGGDDESFLRAVSVDPSCLCGPTGSARLSRAVMQSDTRFLKQVRRQLMGPNRLRYDYSKHRVAEFILRDSGAFEVRGNREEIFRAVMDDAGLLMKRDGDPFKAWNARVAAWQVEATGKSTI